MEKNLHICFVAHFAYGALAGGTSGHIGGVERQTSLMAKWLEKRGHKVIMITWDEGQKNGIEIDGVQVFKLCHKDSGIKGLRFFRPRWTSLIAAMKRVDADIYYQNCAEYTTGQVAMWCRKHNKKFIYSVANDPDCDKKLPEMCSIRERILYRYGLKYADKIIVQTKKQKDMLLTNFGRDSVVIPMPCHGPSDEDYAGLEQHRKDSSRVLWIGRICQQKRPDRLLELANMCPDVYFDFIGPVADSEYARDICKQIKSTANIKYHGKASREQISEFYKKAKILCCTSDFEGFPNTFLEAWSYGLPIISTVDPDDIIAHKGLGKICKSVSELSEGIRELLESREKWDIASEKTRRYYTQNHAVNNVMKKFENEFLSVMDTLK